RTNQEMILDGTEIAAHLAGSEAALVVALADAAAQVHAPGVELGNAAIELCEQPSHPVVDPGGVWKLAPGYPDRIVSCRRFAGGQQFLHPLLDGSVRLGERGISQNHRGRRARSLRSNDEVAVGVAHGPAVPKSRRGLHLEAVDANVAVRQVFDGTAGGVLELD